MINLALTYYLHMHKHHFLNLITLNQFHEMKNNQRI
jgi:hypothetical protein